MKYISLDIETTCLEPRKPENVLMFSMVVEDTTIDTPVEQLPHFTCFIKQNPICGDAYALGLNGWILDFISGRVKNPPYDVCSKDGWITGALHFLSVHFPGRKRINVAGKNVAGFDLQFMPQEIKDQFKHKVLDPATSLVNWDTDTEVPDLATCKRRCGIDTPVAHDAREDAMDVIRVFRAIKSQKYTLSLT